MREPSYSLTLRNLLNVKSLRINFKADGASLDFNSSVDGVDCEIQNALVNIGTEKGSDKIHPQRGTALLGEAVRGAIIDLSSARHSSNFAALYTLSFIKNSLPSSMINSPNLIVKLKLSAAEFDGQKLNLQISGATLDGREFGIYTDLTSSL